MSHSKLLTIIAIVVAVLIIVVLAITFASSVVMCIARGILALVTFIATRILVVVTRILGFAAEGIRAGMYHVNVWVRI